MEFPFVEKLEDLDEAKLQDLLAQYDHEDAVESAKLVVVEKFNKLNADHRKIVDDLKASPNPRRFRQIRRAYVSALIEIAKEYKKIVA
jgi:hypothetical protein